MKTIDQTLADVAAHGWVVNNLFQTQDGKWQCNLRRDGAKVIQHEYATGATAAEALAGAAADSREPRNTAWAEHTPVRAGLSAAIRGWAHGLNHGKQKP